MAAGFEKTGAIIPRVYLPLEEVVQGHFRLGPWLVQPSLNSAVRNGTTSRLTPKAMEVLVCLAHHAGDLVTKEEVLQTVWSDAFVGDDVLKRSISELRRVFEDDVKDPQFIQTIAKRGYRLIASVEWADRSSVEPSKPGIDQVPVARNRKLWMAAYGVTSAALILVLLGAFDVGGLRSRLRVGATPQIRSIAVLPLRNLSSDPNQEYFSDGLTDELITNLAQIGSLRVISHTSTMQYKSTKKPLPEIARELNVDGIVEGTVQRSGDRVRITAQLIHGPSDKHLWANSYEREMRDVLTLEREVTADIADRVQARITLEREPVQPRPVNPKALDAYLQGNYHLNTNAGPHNEELRKAGEFFQQAINADPNFAPAYVGLAEAHYTVWWESDNDLAVMTRASERALVLDPNSSDAWVELGLVRLADWDWVAAEEQTRRAIILNPKI